MWVDCSRSKERCCCSRARSRVAAADQIVGLLQKEAGVGRRTTIKLTRREHGGAARQACNGWLPQSTPELSAITTPMMKPTMRKTPTQSCGAVRAGVSERAMPPAAWHGPQGAALF